MNAIIIEYTCVNIYTNVYTFFGYIIQLSYWMNDDAGETQDQYLHD